MPGPADTRHYKSGGYHFWDIASVGLFKAVNALHREPRPAARQRGRAFTVCFYGTTQSHQADSDTVIGQIYDLIDGVPGVDKIVCDGMGEVVGPNWRPTFNPERTVDPGNFHAPIMARGALGAATGAPLTGLTQTVEQVYNFLSKHKKPCTDDTIPDGDERLVHCINIVGYSRGGVQCFLLGWKLERSEWRDVEVNIFALDPVPGPITTKKMGIVATNVRKLTLLVAEHEHAMWFDVLLPRFVSQLDTGFSGES